MPTYTWTLTRANLIASILRKLGVLGSGDTVQPEDSVVVAEALDARLKELQAIGVLWWNVSGAQTSITLTGGVATATIAPSDYLMPVTMMLDVGTGQEPVEFISHREYQAITNKTEQGEPELVFIDGATCRFWPVPRANGTARLTYQSIAADTENGVAADVPVSMIRSLSEIVAADLVNEYNPPADRAGRLLAGRVEALRTLKMLKREPVDTATVSPEWF